MDDHDFVTKSDLKAGLSELELRLRIWSDERFDRFASREQVAAVEERFEHWCRRLDKAAVSENQVKDIARNSIEKEHNDQWTDRNRFITVALFLASMATTITTFVLLVANAN